MRNSSKSEINVLEKKKLQGKSEKFGSVQKAGE